MRMISVFGQPSSRRRPSFEVIPGEGSISLTWQPATEFVDASALTGHSGYKIYLGSVFDDLSPTLAATIVDTEAVSTTLTGLIVGVLYYPFVQVTADVDSELFPLPEQTAV